MRTLLLMICLLVLTVGCSNSHSQNAPAVKTGAEVLLDEYLTELEGLRVGLVMNPTSRVNGVHMLDTLLHSGIDVRALYAAEHGFRGEAGAGEVIEDGIDQATGLPVFSLYGTSKKPTARMLEDVDILLFDLPDMGVRFYTYNATLGLTLEAAAENDVEVWILDRPNPLGGEYVAGWTLEEQFKSFVGFYPMPIAYGLTMGEIARMAVGEKWIDVGEDLNYRVIRAKGWKRSMKWPDTGLPWVVPSPNLPTFEHAFAYTGTVIFEGTNASEGRGTNDPFLTIGSPDLKYDRQEVRNIEEKHKVKIDTLTFTPRSIPGKAASPKLKDQQTRGFKLSFPNGYGQTDPLKLGLDLLRYAKKHSRDFEITTFANQLFGIDIKSYIDKKEPLPGWQKDVVVFREKRKPYLLY